MGYVGEEERALVDFRLYLPREWAEDRARRRTHVRTSLDDVVVGKKCGVPKNVRYRKRHALALEMLRARKDVLPHSWIAGDSEMGRSTRFRGSLRHMRGQYVLAVPSNTTVRDLEVDPPASRGRKPVPPFEQVGGFAALPLATLAVATGARRSPRRTGPASRCAPARRLRRTPSDDVVGRRGRSRSGARSAACSPAPRAGGWDPRSSSS
jgi:hypothetical protein